MILRMPEPMTAAMIPCHHFYRVLLVISNSRKWQFVFILILYVHFSELERRGQLRIAGAARTNPIEINVAPRL